MATTKYSLGNSRLPMMFRKGKKSKKKSGEKEQLSRSLDDLISIGDDDDGGEEISSEIEWPELASVKKVGPVVMCILPPFSMDFVCSALFSAGATPLITDNVLDMVKDLRNSRAVVVDVSAPPQLITALMNCFDLIDNTCLVVVATQVGSNDRKRDLAMELIERCGPSLVTGRLADIYALGQIVAERNSSDSGDNDGPVSVLSPHISIDHSPREIRKESESAILPSRIQQRIQKRQPKACATVGDLSPRVSPRVSPRTSPRTSPQSSPRHSLTGSPVPYSPRHSPGGVRREMKVGISRKVGRRAPTIHPRVNMKGQFQDSSMLEVNVDDALLNGQKLAAHTRASIYLFEMSLLTDGECDIEIQNPQPGMKNLHSLLPCSGAIAAACVSSVLAETEDNEDVLFHQFSHAMAFWCVAMEEAGNHANQKGRVLPGTLRQALIDALHYLKEPHIRSTARLLNHQTGKAISP